MSLEFAPGLLWAIEFGSAVRDVERDGGRMHVPGVDIE
jgi:hypothetical protein